MGNLEGLETLELSDNTLRYLPESLGGLKRLATLTLSNNGLARLPESLGGLSSIRLLDVSRNAIERVSGGLANLGSLTSLDMRENKLTEVPPLPRGDRLAQVGISVVDEDCFGASVVLKDAESSDLVFSSNSSFLCCSAFAFVAWCCAVAPAEAMKHWPRA